MIRTRVLRRGALVALLTFAWTLLAPLGVQARLAGPADRFPTGPVCTSNALHDGAARATLASDEQAERLPGTEAPAADREAASCVFCHSPATTPGALPHARATLPPADGFLRLECGGQPPGALRGTWPPMPARGPPMHG